MWYYTESSQTLTLTGTGETARGFGSYYENWSAHAAPWNPLTDKIKYIRVQGTITKLGDCIFEDCTSAVGITLPQTLESIGSSAFPYGDNASLEFLLRSPTGAVFMRTAAGCTKNSPAASAIFFLLIPLR